MVMKAALALLPLFALVSADFDGFNEIEHPWAKGRKARCVVNVLDSTNEIFNAGIEAWAASERCTTLPDTTVHCVADISAVVTSVSRMIEYILKAINHCGPLKTTMFKCAQSGLKLETGLAALTSATAKLTAQCPDRAHSIADKAAHDHLARDRVSFGVCVISIKDGIKSLAKAAASFTVHKEHCGDGAAKWQCADFSLTVAEHLVNLGKYILNAAGHCGPSHLFHKGTHCGGAVLNVVSALTEIASGGAAVSGHCAAKPELPAPVPAPTIPVPTPVPTPVAQRLYSEHASDDASTSQITPTNAVLLALLPIVSVAGFFAGSRRQRSGQRFTRELAPMEPSMEETAMLT